MARSVAGRPPLASDFQQPLEALDFLLPILTGAPMARVRQTSDQGLSHPMMVATPWRYGMCDEVTSRSG